MTVPEELKGRKGDMLAARIAMPIIAAVLYGLYEFIAWGTSSDLYPYTYIPVLGGVAAIVGLMTYYLRVVSPTSAKISWMNLLVLLGFLPYFFLTYVIVFFGLYTIYKGVIVSFSIWTILAGIFWVAIGYGGIKCLYLMTEIVRVHDETHRPIK
jgi:hypothetical protein